MLVLVVVGRILLFVLVFVSCSFCCCNPAKIMIIGLRFFYILCPSVFFSSKGAKANKLVHGCSSCGT